MSRVGEQVGEQALGEQALRGSKEYIHRRHVFTVTTQRTVIAHGLMVQLTPSDEPQDVLQAKSTGEAGWTVKKGDKVEVYKAEVRFT